MMLSNCLSENDVECHRWGWFSFMHVKFLSNLGVVDSVCTLQAALGVIGECNGQKPAPYSTRDFYLLQKVTVNV